MLQISLNDTQRAELRQLARTAVGRVSERAHFVLLSDQGQSPPEIGALLGYHAATVRQWLERYQTHQCAGLDDAPRAGRPPKEKHLTAIIQAQASQPPPNSGYLQACWTVGLLALHVLERFGIRVSLASIRRALHAARFHWTRPKNAPARRRDPHGEAKEARLAQVLADKLAHILAADECDVQLLAILRAMWQRVGEQRALPTPGQNAKWGVFGGVNLRTGEWFTAVTARKRSADFLAFLEQVWVAYPVGQIYLLVDNASIHTSKLVKAWLAAHPRLELVYLPTYSGHQLNPVEKLWWDLKREIAANRNFKNLPELQRAIERYFAALTRERVLRLINSKVTRAAQESTLEK